MSRKELIQKTILLIKNTIKSYNIWSTVLLICAVISITVAYLININKELPGKLVEWGFSTLTTLSAGVFQGFKFQRKTKVLRLEFAESRVDNYENLTEFDKKIVDEAIQEIIK